MYSYTYLRADGHVRRVAEGLFDGEAGDEVALLGDVAAALLKEAHRHGDPVQQDLPPRGALGAPRDDLQQRTLATTCGKLNPLCSYFISFHVRTVVHVVVQQNCTQENQVRLVSYPFHALAFHFPG